MEESCPVTLESRIYVKSNNGIWGGSYEETKPILDSLLQAGFAEKEVDRESYCVTYTFLHPSIKANVFVRTVPGKDEVLRELYDKQQRLEEEIERTEKRLALEKEIAEKKAQRRAK